MKSEEYDTVFHGISLERIDENLEEKRIDLKEIKINIVNANIIIPVSEVTLITSIIKELIIKC